MLQLWRDVHQVVEFDAVADASDAQRRAIDAGVRADLDVVADLDASDLRELLIAVRAAHESEAVGAEHAARSAAPRGRRC